MPALGLDLSFRANGLMGNFTSATLFELFTYSFSRTFKIQIRAS